MPLHLRQGEGLDVREHQFIAATDNLDYSFERIKGVQNMLLGGSGFFMDKFRATDGDALVWLHGHGNVFLVQLDEGEQLDVEAGGWLYKDPVGQARSDHDGARRPASSAAAASSPGTASPAPAGSRSRRMFIAPLEGAEHSRGGGAGGMAGALIGGLARRER